MSETEKDMGTPERVARMTTKAITDLGLSVVFAVILVGYVLYVNWWVNTKWTRPWTTFRPRLSLAMNAIIASGIWCASRGTSTSSKWIDLSRPSKKTYRRIDNGISGR